MLANKALFRLRFWIFWWACALLGAGLPAPAPAAGGIETLSASTPAVRRQAPASQLGVLAGSKPAAGLLAASCFPDSAQRLFEPVDPSLDVNYVNVASFFDIHERSSSNHYFIKYFQPPSWTCTACSLQVTGLGFRNRGTLLLYPSAGVVRTSASSPFFPRPADLAELQVHLIPGRGKSAETCVDFRAQHIFLKPGEAAWVALQFPEAADTSEVGVLVDRTAPDHLVDFLTPNGGELWYRPDATVGSAYDWDFTVYYEPAPSAPAVKGGRQEAVWAEVKSLYR